MRSPKPLNLLALLALGVPATLLSLAACAHGSGSAKARVAGSPGRPDTPIAAQMASPAPPAAAEAPRPREADSNDALCAPLLIEPEIGFGTSVVMRRLPTAADLEDMRFYTGLRQVLLALPDWPATYAQLRPLQQVILPDGAEIVVLLPGWPPTREALGAWNLVGGNLRLIIVVDGPPADRALIAELNRVRSLERLIVQMEHPSRSGFERLQRPLSFRVVKP